MKSPVLGFPSPSSVSLGVEEGLYPTWDFSEAVLRGCTLMAVSAPLWILLKDEDDDRDMVTTCTTLHPGAKNPAGLETSKVFMLSSQTDGT